MDKFKKRYLRSETNEPSGSYTKNIYAQAGPENVGKVFRFNQIHTNFIRHGISVDVMLHGDMIMPDTNFEVMTKAADKHRKLHDNYNMTFDMGMQRFLVMIIRKHYTAFMPLIMNAYIENQSKLLDPNWKHPLRDMLEKCIREDRIITKEEWEACKLEMKIVAV